MRLGHPRGKDLLLCAVTGAVLAAGFGSLALAKPKSTSAHLSAQQILAKNAAARGGLTAWRQVQTMVWVGHIESAHAAVPGMRFILSQKRPNRVRFEMDAMGERTLRVFDGRQGWKLRPSHGRPDVQRFTTEEERFAQTGPGLDGPLMGYAEEGSSVSFVGIDKIETRNAYHLIVHTAAGETRHVWVDAESFLEVRYDRPAGGASDAARTVSVVYRDYKATDGLQIPSIVETGVGSGNTPDRMVIERVVLNPPLNDKTFAIPGAAPVRERVPFSPHRGTLPAGVLPAPLSSPPSPNPGSAPQ